MICKGLPAAADLLAQPLGKKRCILGVGMDAVAGVLLLHVALVIAVEVGGIQTVNLLAVGQTGDAVVDLL